MHMADALISAATGGVMWAVSSGAASYSVKKVQIDLDENLEYGAKKIPLMGVMGAFVFAAQMINFTIPGTGSSGHIGGGLLLAVLLGPHAGFLTLFCILAIQAMFFADGGLLALGCNIFNMGFFTCFVAYPLVYKKITRKVVSRKTIFIGSMLAAVVGLQIGSLSVVLQTLLSGKTELPFKTFLMLMQPIHLAIGIVEGLITAAVLTFVLKARPEMLETYKSDNSIKKYSYKKIIVVFICFAVLLGGVGSWYSSSNPDGLEWSVEKAIQETETEETGTVHKFLGYVQDKISFLPDYNFKNISDNQSVSSVKMGTSVSGVIGSIITLALAFLIGVISKNLKSLNKVNRDN